MSTCIQAAAGLALAYAASAALDLRLILEANEPATWITHLFGTWIT